MTAADKFTWTRYDTLLRLDFVSFAQRCLRELSPRSQTAMNWHIEIIAAKLMAVRAGKIRGLIINLPPRYLKSLLASVAFPAWCLGHDPAAQIRCVSYAQELADKLSRDCRGAAVAGAPAMSEFETTAQGLPARDLGRRRADRTRVRNLTLAFLRLSRPPEASKWTR